MTRVAEPSLTCETCPLHSKTHVITEEVLSYSSQTTQSLEDGDAFFYFSCKPGQSHTDTQKRFIDSIINLSSFSSEVDENNVPHVNIYDAHDAEKYTIIVTQAIYLLPQLSESMIRPEFLASPEYHRNCQIKGTVIHDAESSGTTIRFTKTIIKYIYKLTVQFKISRISGSTVDSLSKLLGCEFSHGILLERTKKDTSKVDSTAKVKSVILYRPARGGYLMHNLTIVLNTFIPSIVAPIIHTFSSGGALEVKETAENTRKYIQKVADVQKQ
mmetsp:Transcript_21386/g.33236  ORF Transcript_21386/g.33236 Transcript_21386/m.33236 type:complete len:271 (-) Transcript_21386:20-832(-)